MQGASKLAAVRRSTPHMAAALPGLPMQQTVMVRLVRILSASMTGYFEPVFRKTRLSENSFHVLCLLVAADGGEASPSELSDLVGTSRGNMTRILDQLEQDGLISRRAEARDGRRWVLQITPAGRETAHATVPQISGPLLQAFARLTPEQTGALEQALRAVILTLDDGR